MVNVKLIFFAICIGLAFPSYGKPLSNQLWPALDIEDPQLTKNTVMRQCQRSLKYAPKELEAWCEKAYKMGAWEALLYIGYHTGDGSRYVNEVKRRAAEKEHIAIRKLAWINYNGIFIETNLAEAARLYNIFLAQESDSSAFMLRSIHYNLAKIYTTFEDWPRVIEHAQYVIDQNVGDGSDALAKDLKAKALSKLNN
ncbi:hypothetical protein CWC31_14215 [Pseudoalteromonas ruthenica]|uniref:hypothetical protein n=1 Tax=Pseudoalteromonas ruthenica TaxID=151081 RepID=UPI001108C758|nr:hypothetical protein [Pseudoalteromonas ruthenica]TLX49997.1 hypothetical protein CWC31_14215 [Pseudoalteromonas ruthenica]